jgi:hypothetical protein
MVRTNVGVQHCHSSPSAINLAEYACANSGMLGLNNITMYVKPRMHHGDAWRKKMHMHFRRLAGVGSERSIGVVVQPFHQI